MAGILTFIWFYWLAPWRHLRSNMEWWSDHSVRSIWREAQRQINRTGIDHDSSIMIGRYGDKSWMEWVVKNLNPVLQGGDCGEGQMHLPDAPMYITNQRVANLADWSSWWITNRNKSQVEWIRDGFHQKGLNLESPLTTNNIIALLKLVADSRENRIIYNAQRWLRDAEIPSFDPESFNLELVPSEDRESATKGLIKYSRWLGEHQDDPGRLQMDEHALDEPASEESKDTFERTSWSWMLKIFLISLTARGVLLLRRSFHMVPIKHALP